MSKHKLCACWNLLPTFSRTYRKKYRMSCPYIHLISTPVCVASTPSVKRSAGCVLDTHWLTTEMRLSGMPPCPILTRCPWIHVTLVWKEICFILQHFHFNVPFSGDICCPDHSHSGNKHTKMIYEIWILGLFNCLVCVQFKSTFYSR